MPLPPLPPCTLPRRAHVDVRTEPAIEERRRLGVASQSVRPAKDQGTWGEPRSAKETESQAADRQGRRWAANPSAEWPKSGRFEVGPKVQNRTESFDEFEDRSTRRESAGRPPKGREAVKKLQKQERLQEEDFNNQAKKLAVRLRSGAFCTRGGVRREPIGVASRVGEPGTRFGERGHIFDSRHSRLDLNSAYACGAFYSCPGYGPKLALGSSLIASPDVTWFVHGQSRPSDWQPVVWSSEPRGLVWTKEDQAERRGFGPNRGDPCRTKDDQAERGGFGLNGRDPCRTKEG
ncbi:hypothetical protein DFH11DRAFT_1555936 [Phellopilus nigrolimitatus]|nr:hypothetical protein DFH11DRAFT_1555936 [Phellopilus nigrolimitatus]